MTVCILCCCVRFIVCVYVIRDRFVKKTNWFFFPQSPDNVIFVMDATIGQACESQVSEMFSPTLSSSLLLGVGWEEWVFDATFAVFVLIVVLSKETDAHTHRRMHILIDGCTYSSCCGVSGLLAINLSLTPIRPAVWVHWNQKSIFRSTTDILTLRYDTTTSVELTIVTFMLGLGLGFFPVFHWESPWRVCQGVLWRDCLHGLLSQTTLPQILIRLPMPVTIPCRQQNIVIVASGIVMCFLLVPIVTSAKIFRLFCVWVFTAPANHIDSTC